MEVSVIIQKWSLGIFIREKLHEEVFFSCKKIDYVRLYTECYKNNLNLKVIDQVVKTGSETDALKRLMGGQYNPLENPLVSYPKTKKKKVIIISGPTCSGKSSLSMEIATLLGGEIISADSVQVYRGLDIGSAKASKEDREKIPHHMIDVRDLTEPFSVVDYYHETKLQLDSICARDRVPIIVGGTGFYIHSLLYGPPKGPPSQPEIREQIEKDLERFSPDALYDRLQKFDPEYAKTITLHDKTKIIRALEIIAITGDKVSSLSYSTNSISPEYDFRCWFVHHPREILYKLIEERCDKMLNQGLIEEVITLLEKGLKDNRPCSTAIGYRQVIQYLESQKTDDDYQTLLKDFKTASRRYAKRQFTWFRKEPIFKWLDLDIHDKEIAADIISQDYLMEE